MGDITAITPLTNIAVVEADLKRFKPDIVTRYFMAGQSDFTEQIEAAKRVLHREIQYRDGLTETQMGFVKDTQLSTMRDKIAYRAIAIIMLMNGLDILADSWDKKAQKMPTQYTLDLDNDDVQNSGEVKETAPIRFGR